MTGLQPEQRQEAWELSRRVLSWEETRPVAEAHSTATELCRRGQVIRTAVLDANRQRTTDSTVAACIQATVGEARRRLSLSPPATSKSATRHAQSLARLIQALLRAHDLLATDPAPGLNNGPTKGI